MLYLFVILSFLLLPSASHAQSVYETHDYIEEKCDMADRSGYEYREGDLFVDARLDFGPDIRPDEPSIGRFYATKAFYSNGFRNLDFWTYSARIQDLELTYSGDGGVDLIVFECIDGSQCVDINIRKQDKSERHLSSESLSIYCEDPDRVQRAFKHVFDNYVIGRKKDPFQ